MSVSTWKSMPDHLELELWMAVNGYMGSGKHALPPLEGQPVLLTVQPIVPQILQFLLN